MKVLKNYIESGILELYVLGMTSTEESAEVQEMAMLHEEIRTEIDRVCEATEEYAQAHAVKPPITLTLKKWRADYLTACFTKWLCNCRL
jgi:hypothetical protein